MAGDAAGNRPSHPPARSPEFFTLLGFYQTQDFGTEVFFTVRPAQTTTGNAAEAQVHTFDPRRVDEDFELRYRLGQLWNQVRVELEAEVRRFWPLASGW
jgi:hypothetical protein